MRGLRCLCLGCCVIRRDLQPCIGRWGTLLPVALKVTGPGQVASPSSDTPLCVCVCVCVLGRVSGRSPLKLSMIKVETEPETPFRTIIGGGDLVATNSLVVSNSCDPMDYSPPGSSDHEDSPGKNTGVGCHFLLQGIFLTQESNLGLLHCRQILHQLSYKGSPPTIFGTLYLVLAQCSSWFNNLKINGGGRGTVM